MFCNLCWGTTKAPPKKTPSDRSFRLHICTIGGTCRGRPWARFTTLLAAGLMMLNPIQEDGTNPILSRHCQQLGGEDWNRLDRPRNSPRIKPPRWWHVHNCRSVVALVGLVGHTDYPIVITTGTRGRAGEQCHHLTRIIIKQGSFVGVGGEQRKEETLTRL